MRNLNSASSTPKATARRTDEAIAARWFGEAADAGNVSAEIEYAIRLFNGKGVPQDEAAAARWFQRAAQAGNPIAQNRLARILATGLGMPADGVAAAKWHYLARSAGKTDPWLDNFIDNLSEVSAREP